MLTPIQLSAAFKKFCSEKACDECYICRLNDTFLKNHHGMSVSCDIIWFVYEFLANRWLLHKNPNDLNELLAEDDLQKLVVSIIQVWNTAVICGDIPNLRRLHNPSFDSVQVDTVHPRQCDFCPQRSECDVHRTSCRLYFALTNYRHLLDVIQHAATLRETC